MIPHAAIVVATVAASLAVDVLAAEPQSQPESAPPAASAKSAATDALRVTEDPLLAADLLILAALDRPFAAPRTFKDVTAREVMDAVRDATGLDVQIDRAAVGEGGGWELVRVSCVCQTPRQALDTVAAMVSDGIRELYLDVAAGLPVLTDASSAPRLAAVRHHDLRTLLARRDTRERPTSELMKEIADTVRDAIAPDSWIENGGDGGWIRTLDSTLIVSATPARQQAVMKFLAGLQASLPSPAILWEFRIAEVSSEVSSADIALVLGSAAELDALVAAGGARIVSAPKVVSLRREAASLSVGREGDVLDVAVEPVAGSSAFAITVRESRAGGVRSLSLRSIDGARGAGLMDSEGRRILLEVVGTPSDDAIPKSGEAVDD